MKGAFLSAIFGLLFLAEMPAVAGESLNARLQKRTLDLTEPAKGNLVEQLADLAVRY